MTCKGYFSNYSNMDSKQMEKVNGVTVDSGVDYSYSAWLFVADGNNFCE